MEMGVVEEAIVDGVEPRGLLKRPLHMVSNLWGGGGGGGRGGGRVWAI